MLQDLVDKKEISKEDKEFIDMTHRNTELLEENQSLKKQLEEKENIACNWNKLKNIAKSQSDFKQKLGNDRVYFEIDELLEKMQELESGDK